MSDWRERAACRNVDPELFFPVGTSEDAQAQAAAAKQVCASCPVREECLRWAMGDTKIVGVWGGLDEVERASLRRRLRRQRAAA